MCWVAGQIIVLMIWWHPSPVLVSIWPLPMCQDQHMCELPWSLNLSTTWSLTSGPPGGYLATGINGLIVISMIWLHRLSSFNLTVIYRGIWTWSCMTLVALDGFTLAFPSTERLVVRCCLVVWATVLNVHSIQWDISTNATMHLTAGRRDTDRLHVLLDITLTENTMTEIGQSLCKGVRCMSYSGGIYSLSQHGYYLLSSSSQDG